MPMINIITWPTKPHVKHRIMQEITRIVHTESGAPLNKITVTFQEVEKDSWCEAGILGSDAHFAEKSRRQTYD